MMSSSIRVAADYNTGGHLLYVVDFPGAYARARTREEALSKLPNEIRQYCQWCEKRGGSYYPSGYFVRRALPY